MNWKKIKKEWKSFNTDTKVYIFQCLFWYSIPFGLMIANFDETNIFYIGYLTIIFMFCFLIASIKEVVIELTILNNKKRGKK